MNYHYYSGWEQFTLLRPRFQAQLKKLGIANKPVWLTETGATSDATLTMRTNYPNSAETQAAEIFRRIVSAWGNGDAFAMWHTYITNGDTTGTWRAYGIRTEKNNPQPAFYAFKLLTRELVPFTRVDKIAADGRGVDQIKMSLCPTKNLAPKFQRKVLVSHPFESCVYSVTNHLRIRDCKAW